MSSLEPFRDQEKRHLVPPPLARGLKQTIRMEIESVDNISATMVNGSREIFGRRRPGGSDDSFLYSPSERPQMFQEIAWLASQLLFRRHHAPPHRRQLLLEATLRPFDSLHRERCCSVQSRVVTHFRSHDRHTGAR